MQHIDISKGFKAELAGMPDSSVIQLPEPETVAVCALDIPYIRPKILVRENDPVKTGTPLFHDKRNKNICYVSPGSGTVKNILFGKRRRLKEIVISLDKKEDFIQFDTPEPADLSQTPRADIVELLQKAGLWQCFRQFPFRDTADDTHTPAMIIVSLNGNDPHSPHPGIVLENRWDLFEEGLALLPKFTDRVVVSARRSSLKGLDRIRQSITHTTPDFYPAWDPGAVLYHLKTRQEENESWCISAEHLTLIAEFFRTGTYPVRRVVAVTRGSDKKPHIITRQGAPVRRIAGSIPPGSLIATGRFNGRQAEPDSHLGFFDTTLTLLEETETEELFGFVRPGLTKPSVSKTFLSCLVKSPQQLDCNSHGEERACINCSYCTRVCPVDLMPSFIFKALLSDDIEDALDYGLLDCVQCGLCAFVCPSKIELTKLLSDGITAHLKDKA